MKTNSPAIIEFKTRNPQQNLPPHLGRKRGESNFVAAFARAYANARLGQGVGGRQFEVVGHGIADFVWVDVQQPSAARDEDNSAYSFFSLTAFELKLRNWKRALHQAYRYSYFADKSVVVLPPDAVAHAAENIELFRKLEIGLWTFNPDTSRIYAVHEPKSTKPRNAFAKARAMSLFQRKIKFRKLIE
jgi:hypothetical protein